MKQRHFVLILLIIVAVSLTIPLKFSTDWRDYLEFAGTILGALCTVYALVIAILLYDRFSVERDVLSKQLEAVAALSKNVNLSGLYVNIEDEKGMRTMGDYWYGLNTIPQEFLSYKLRLSDLTYRRLNSLADNVELQYLPKSIYKKLQNLQGERYGHFVDYGENEVKDNCYVNIFAILPLVKVPGGNTLSDYLTSRMEYEYPLTLGMFLQSLEELKESIVEWSKEHGHELFLDKPFMFEIDDYRIEYGTKKPLEPGEFDIFSMYTIIGFQHD